MNAIERTREINLEFSFLHEGDISNNTPQLPEENSKQRKKRKIKERQRRPLITEVKCLSLNSLFKYLFGDTSSGFFYMTSFFAQWRSFEGKRFLCIQFTFFSAEKFSGIITRERNGRDLGFHDFDSIAYERLNSFCKDYFWDFNLSSMEVQPKEGEVQDQVLFFGFNNPKPNLGKKPNHKLEIDEAIFVR